MNWRELKKNGHIIIASAVSGGLDSCVTTHWLKSKGFIIHCYTVDLGQPDEDLDLVKVRMEQCGADEATIISGVDVLADAGLKLLQSQSRYEGGYWNTTAIARPITVKQIIPYFKKKGIGAFFHGATGRGNDQVRFQLAMNVLAPEVTVYAPWRDSEFLERFPGRNEMLKYCEENNLPIKSKAESRYSTDANLLGLTHEGGDIEDVEQSPYFIDPVMGVWPWDAPSESEYISVVWDKGVPKSINGIEMGVESIFKEANQIAGRHGVGIGTHVIENRYVGVKSRGIYESPAMEMLGQIYEYLLQFVLDRRARNLFNNISQILSSQIYDGYWFDLATTSILQALKPINQVCSGEISVRIYKGKVLFDKAKDISQSLYSNDSSMESVGDYNHADAEGFLNILGVSAKNYGVQQLDLLNEFRDDQTTS